MANIVRVHHHITSNVPNKHCFRGNLASNPYLRLTLANHTSVFPKKPLFCYRKEPKVAFSTSFFRNKSSNLQFTRHGGHDHEVIVGKGAKLDKEKIKLDNQLATRVTWYGLWSNVLLSGGKAFVGFISGSSALIADAAHSFSDLISDIVTLVTLRSARQPADSNHPHGHGRFESAGALAVGGLLIATGFGIAHHSYESLMNPVVPTTLALYAAVASILIKEAIFQATVFVGKKQQSQLLIANAWHHRSDAISSIIALFGIGGAQLGFPYLDPIAGIAVAGLIMKIGASSSWESLKELTDTIVDKKIVDAVEEILRNTNGVKDFSQIRTRKMGSYFVVDLNISVDPSLTISASHQISERIKHEIFDTIARVHEVLIYTTPADQKAQNFAVVEDEDHHNHHDHTLPGKTRLPEDVERDVKGIITTYSDFRVTRVLCHYRLPQTSSIDFQELSVDVHVEVDPIKSHLTIDKLQEVVTKAERQIETEIPDIYRTKIYLHLNSHKK